MSEREDRTSIKNRFVRRGMNFEARPRSNQGTRLETAHALYFNFNLDEEFPQVAKAKWNYNSLRNKEKKDRIVLG